MLVNDVFQKCVAFLYVDTLADDGVSYKRVPAATALLLGVPSGIDDLWAIYAVTNLHVVNQMHSFRAAYLRLNYQHGEIIDHVVSPDAWFQHPSNDVAIAMVRFNIQHWDHAPLPLELLATSEYVINRGIGPGDDVFFVGLFTQHPGLERMQPIIRFGNISMMPGEPVHVRLDSASDPVPVTAYLVEARSWSGHSGSPAFVHFPLQRDGMPGAVTIGHGPPTLLGIVCGHFDVKEKARLVGDLPQSEDIGLNSGIAIVIPAQAIIDTVMMQDAVEERTRSAELAKQHVADVTPDTGKQVGVSTEKQRKKRDETLE